MQILQRDYMTQLLKLYVPGDVAHWDQLSARVEITQPCSYRQTLTAPIQMIGKHANIELRYPLMDDGAWEQIEGFCKATAYGMGTYTFKVDLLNNGHHIVTETTQFDQDQLYANSWKTRIRNDFPAGFIECAPQRPVCIDHDEVPVSIRLKTDRVSHCRVRLDVTARRGNESRVEPVELDLTDELQIVRFDHSGWERGEYWVRIAVIENGEPIGPYMIRKFWKEVIGAELQPQPPLKLGPDLQYMVDDWLFEDAHGLDFWPMSYGPNPDKPAITMDRPWEYGMMAMRRLIYDETEQLYKMEYSSNSETYRRGGHGWHFLVDEIEADQSGLPLPWEFLDKSDKRSVTVRRPDEPAQFDDAIIGHQLGRYPKIEPTDSLQIAYRKLLWSALQNGVSVEKFNIPPQGYSCAILPNVQPLDQRRTDYVMLAVPGIRSDRQLPPATEIDVSCTQIFEMYPEDLNRPSYLCLAISKDGVDWEKPELGKVAFHGSKSNNILCVMDDVDRDYARSSHEADTRAVISNTTERKFKFRLYDAGRDGPVDMDKMFMGHIAQGRNEKIDFVWPEDFEDSLDALGFKPELRAYYPMVYHGQGEYLFLSDKALVYMGSGMDLMHSSESIRHQIERRDDLTVFWYYRPNSPGYPPHNWPCDNHQGPLRNLAVMWSNDGIHFHKRSCIGPDEFDPPGMQFYIMGLIGEIPQIHKGRTMLRRSSSPGVSVRDGQMYVAELRCYDGAQQTQYPELIWSRDLLHWHRFTRHRAPLVKLGTEEGAYNWGMYFQDASYYPFKDKDGNDAWWLSNSANSARHHHIAVTTRHPTVQSAQSDYPQYSESPFFVDWPTLFRRSQQFLRTPCFTHIKPGRLAYTAPVDGQGEFTTWPIQFDGRGLVLNAEAERGGNLRIEVLDAAGQIVPGYGIEDCDPLIGDAVEHRPTWGPATLADLSGRQLKFRVVLHRARLYTLHIVG